MCLRSNAVITAENAGCRGSAKYSYQPQNGFLTMIAGGYTNVSHAVCVCRSCAFALREVHVLWAREGLQRPVDEAVEEDEAGAAGPDHQDGDEGGTKVIDYLRKGRRQKQIGMLFVRVLRGGRYIEILQYCATFHQFKHSKYQYLLT